MIVLDNRIKELKATKAKIFELTDNYETANNDLRNRVLEKQEAIKQITQELHELNRHNLNKTYDLEDLIDQIDALKYNDSMFLTANKAKTIKKQESYSQL